MQNHPDSVTFFASEHSLKYQDFKEESNGKPSDEINPLNIVKIENEEYEESDLPIKSEDYDNDESNYYEDSYDYYDSATKEENGEYEESDLPIKRKAKSVASKTHKCSKCSKVFDKKVELKQHRKNEHDVSTFKCKECSKVFDKRSQLKLHRKNEHNAKSHRSEPVTNYKCKICSQELVGIKEFWNHNKDVHDSPFVPCEKCDMTFATPRKLYFHR